MKLPTLVLLASLLSLGAVQRPPSPADKEVVRLGWNYAQGSDGIAKFKVYSGPSPGTYDTVTETEGFALSLVVPVPTTGTYYFVATAVDTNGLESLPSNEVSAVITSRPVAPNNLTASRITILID